MRHASIQFHPTMMPSGTTEKLRTIYKARTVAGKKFRLLFEDGRMFAKTDFGAKKAGFPDVFGRIPHADLPPWEDGNFELYENGAWRAAKWNEYDVHVITRAGGTPGETHESYGRCVDASAPPWTEGNFEVKEGGTWVLRPYDEVKATALDVKRSSILKRVKSYGVEFTEQVEITVKGATERVQRARLEASAGLYKALDEKVATIKKLNQDPLHFLFWIIYREAASPQEKYSVDFEPMTEQQVAALEAERGEAKGEPEAVSAFEDDLKVDELPF